MHLQVFRRVYRSSYLWTLDDYYRSIWSPRHCIVINNLPADSLLYGKFLAFDRKDVNAILFRVKRQVFSYNHIKAQLREVCNIQKEYEDDEICSGFILPCEVSTIPPPSGQLTLLLFFIFPWQFNEWKFAANSGQIPPTNVSLLIIFLSLGMPRTKAETGIAVETSGNTYAYVNSPENTRILVYFHEGNAELARTITLTHQPGFNWIPAYNFQRPFWRYFNVTSTDDHHMPLK